MSWMGQVSCNFQYLQAIPVACSHDGRRGLNEGNSHPRSKLCTLATACVDGPVPRNTLWNSPCRLFCYEYALVLAPLRANCPLLGNTFCDSPCRLSCSQQHPSRLSVQTVLFSATPFAPLRADCPVLSNTLCDPPCRLFCYESALVLAALCADCSAIDLPCFLQPFVRTVLL